MNSAKDFFDSIINENDTSLFTYGLKPIEMPNFEKAQLIQNNTPDAFLKEYHNAVSAVNKIIDNDSGTNTLNSSAILLRLIHINAEFKIDSKSLAELLIALSNQIKEFNTTYERHKYDEYLWGFTVAYKMEIKVYDITKNKKFFTPLSRRFFCEGENLEHILILQKKFFMIRCKNFFWRYYNEKNFYFYYNDFGYMCSLFYSN